jgi:hypothetical protein
MLHQIYDFYLRFLSAAKRKKNPAPEPASSHHSVGAEEKPRPLLLCKGHHPQQVDQISHWQCEHCILKRQYKQLAKLSLYTKLRPHK